MIRLVNNNHLQLLFTSAQVINEWKVLKYKSAQHMSSQIELFGA